MKNFNGIYRFVISIATFVFGLLSISAQNDSITRKAHFRLRYVINEPELDSTFVDNAARMADMRKFLESVRDDSLLSITGVKFRATASPDGSYEFNRWLSENRLRTFKEFIYQYIELPDSLIESNVSEISWDDFRNRVAESELSYRDTILAIIDEEPRLVPWVYGRHIDQRLLKLKKLARGQAWEALKSPILRDLRFGDALFSYTYIFPGVNAVGFAVEPRAVDKPDILRPVPVVYDSWMPRFYLKSNLIGWALFSANLGVEFDLGKHWSFSVPVYYCAMDYFKSTVKFRNFTVQPEFRYWPSLKRDANGNLGNDGFFIGAHFEMCYYNFAFNGQYRYQDHRGRTPALGGGLTLGYRFPISKNKRWRLEFSAGAGIYPLDYDLFDNTPDVKDGQLMGRKKETYIGLDMVQATFSYSFDITRHKKTWKKGGAR
ncbi:MAG: DUF3575 domain-containing protein [Muribaculaceae bacterium]|nr:DUF3575 domain-containing protein [Muribaculaceae bacterium]